MVEQGLGDWRSTMVEQMSLEINMAMAETSQRLEACIARFCEQEEVLMKTLKDDQLRYQKEVRSSLSPIMSHDTTTEFSAHRVFDVIPDRNSIFSYGFLQYSGDNGFGYGGFLSEEIKFVNVVENPVFASLDNENNGVEESVVSKPCVTNPNEKNYEDVGKLEKGDKGTMMETVFTESKNVGGQVKMIGYDELGADESGKGYIGRSLDDEGFDTSRSGVEHGVGPGLLVSSQGNYIAEMFVDVYAKKYGVGDATQKNVIETVDLRTNKEIECLDIGCGVLHTSTNIYGVDINFCNIGTMKVRKFDPGGDTFNNCQGTISKGEKNNKLQDLLLLDDSLMLGLESAIWVVTCSILRNKIKSPKKDQTFYSDIKLGVLIQLLGGKITRTKDDNLWGGREFCAIVPALRSVTSDVDANVNLLAIGVVYDDTKGTKPYRSEFKRLSVPHIFAELHNSLVQLSIKAAGAIGVCTHLILAYISRFCRALQILGVVMREIKHLNLAATFWKCINNAKVDSEVEILDNTWCAFESLIKLNVLVLEGDFDYISNNMLIKLKRFESWRIKVMKSETEAYAVINHIGGLYKYYMSDLRDGDLLGLSDTRSLLKSLAELNILYDSENDDEKRQSEFREQCEYLKIANQKSQASDESQRCNTLYILNKELRKQNRDLYENSKTFAISIQDEIRRLAVKMETLYNFLQKKLQDMGNRLSEAEQECGYQRISYQKLQESSLNLFGNCTTLQKIDEYLKKPILDLNENSKFVAMGLQEETRRLTVEMEAEKSVQQQKLQEMENKLSEAQEEGGYQKLTNQKSQNSAMDLSKKGNKLQEINEESKKKIKDLHVRCTLLETSLRETQLHYVGQILEVIRIQIQFDHVYFDNFDVLLKMGKGKEDRMMEFRKDLIRLFRSVGRVATDVTQMYFRNSLMSSVVAPPDRNAEEVEVALFLLHAFDESLSDEALRTVNGLLKELVPMLLLSRFHCHSNTVVALIYSNRVISFHLEDKVSIWARGNVMTSHGSRDWARPNDNSRPEVNENSQGPENGNAKKGNTKEE